MTFPEWNQLGVPDGFGPFRLLYNPPSEKVVIELRGIRKDNGPYHRIHVKHRDAEEYQPIQEPDPTTSQESAVISLTQPVLFFNAVKITPEPGGRFAGEWEAVYSFDLSSSVLQRCFERRTLPPPPSFSACRILDLISISEGGHALYATIALNDGEPQSMGRPLYKYCLGRIELSTQEITPISWLRAAFF